MQLAELLDHKADEFIKMIYALPTIGTDESTLKNLEEKLKSLQEKFNIAEEEIKALKKELSRANDKLKAQNEWIECPCPYCGVKTSRKIDSGECHCDICGMNFEAIDPTRSNTKDDVEKWRTDHTIDLEPLRGRNAYMIDLNKVRDQKILIIDLADRDENNDIQIEYLRSTKYVISTKQEDANFEKVKTLIFQKGLVPQNHKDMKNHLSQMKDLKHVVTYDRTAKCFIDDKEYLYFIKN